MRWHVRQEHDQWRVADYWLSVEDGVVRYRAEGRDNPKDLWGWDRSYPPLELTELALSELRELFGEEIVRELRRPAEPRPSAPATDPPAPSP